LFLRLAFLPILFANTGEYTMSDRLSEAMQPIEKIIIRSMHEGVVTLECNGAVFSMNPAAERILQLREAEVKGKKYEEAFSPAAKNREFMAIFDRLIRDGRPTLNKEVSYTRAHGQTLDLSVAGAFLEIDECEPGMQNAMVVFRDITAFKSLERVRRKAVDHLSHELKTPLSIILASVEQLGKKDITPEKFVKNLDRMKRNLARLTAIQKAVEEILTPVEVNPAPIDAVAFFREILAGLGEQVKGRSVTLTERIQPIQTEILDPGILRIVLETLVKNAVENSPDEGEVIVSFESVPTGLLLQVRDYGVGIPVNELDFIFEGFHHTQDTEDYSSKQPFDFNAGGKGLELLRLKVLAEQGIFDITFESRECGYVSTHKDNCPGRISSCPHVQGPQGCEESGGTVFSVLFYV
jgi:two-component system phosphate regulon sensor histidine kinase PhoR